MTSPASGKPYYYLCPTSIRAGQVTQQFLTMVKDMGLEGKIIVTCPDMQALQRENEELRAIIERNTVWKCDFESLRESYSKLSTINQELESLRLDYEHLEQIKQNYFDEIQKLRERAERAEEYHEKAMTRGDRAMDERDQLKIKITELEARCAESESEKERQIDWYKCNYTELESHNIKLTDRIKTLRNELKFGCMCHALTPDYGKYGKCGACHALSIDDKMAGGE